MRGKKTPVLSERDMLLHFILRVQSYFKSPVILCSVNANVMIPALFARCLEMGLVKDFLQVGIALNNYVIASDTKAFIISTSQ